MRPKTGRADVAKQFRTEPPVSEIKENELPRQQAGSALGKGPVNHRCAQKQGIGKKNDKKKKLRNTFKNTFKNTLKHSKTRRRKNGSHF